MARREPIIVAKARANLLDRRAHRLLQVCECEVDGGYSGVCVSAASVAWMERKRNPGTASLALPILGVASATQNLTLSQSKSSPMPRRENSLSGGLTKTLTIIRVKIVMQRRYPPKVVSADAQKSIRTGARQAPSNQKVRNMI